MTEIPPVQHLNLVPLTMPDPLVVHCVQGWSKRLVVSFAGVGNMGVPIPKPEFIGSASGNGENHVLFISDTSRSWLNGPDVVEQIVEAISAYQKLFNIEETVALGNSMGGFAALVMARFMKFETVISFSPQFSIHHDHVPEEHRWDHLATRIADWRFPTVGDLTGTESKYFIFHGDVDGELPHMARFPANRFVHHYVLVGAGHNIAKILNKRKRLAPVIDAAIEQRSRVVRRILERSFRAKNFQLLRREVYEEEYPDRVAPYQGETLAGGMA